MKRLALRSALTETAREERIRVLEAFSFEEPSTKRALDVLDALDLWGRVLVVLAAPDSTVEKSFRNLPNVRMCYPGNLGTHEVLYADWVLFTKDAIEAVTS
jgi:large subunit ribosomal protein L4